MTNKLNIVNHSDPGHSWYEVPIDLIKKLNIENHISSFSYMDEKNVYLEEDCDASIFFKAYLKIENVDRKLFQENIFIIDSYKEQSPIRSKQSYNKTRI